ncbi:MAG: outer membrane beta-barrel protein [Gammaproteobacteria bacterium]|nr:outer membrane beta-barrel protein [Gammaproteobacteria bacterium]
MRKTLLATTLLATIAATPAAFAHEAGDIIVRAGAVTVTTHESTSGVKTSALGNLNGKATLDNDTQLGLNFAYMVTDNIGIELLAASPFKHDVSIKNTAVGSMKLGSIKHLPPTLSAVYYPLDSKSAFQPYIGAGINYTWFFDESVSSTAKQNLNASNFNVKNSWGWAAQVGADYMLTDNIMINGQIRYIDIDTDATLNTVAGRTKVNVDVKPWVYMVGLGYKF